MLQALFLIILLEPLLVSGTFTCMGSDWVLDGSKCLKLIAGSPKDGQAQCSIEDSSAKLVLPPNSQEAANVAAKFPNKTIWVGLRFQNGEAWIWNDGSRGSINWDSFIQQQKRKNNESIILKHIRSFCVTNSTCKTYNRLYGVYINIGSPMLPQLCTGVIGDSHKKLNIGDMYDRFCYSKDGLICQTETDVLDSCEPDWTKIGSLCYKILFASDSGVTYSVARILCTNENAKVMMPQSKNEAELIVTTLNCGLFCWVGLADFDADHTYTWEDGTNESQSNLYFGSSEPNNRDLDYVCAYIQDDKLFNRECTRIENIICEIAAIDSSASAQMSTPIESTSTQMSTPMESTSTQMSTPMESTSTQMSTPTGSSSTQMSTPIESTSTQMSTPKESTSTQMSTPMESTSSKIQLTTYASAFMKNPITLAKKSTQPEATSDKILTTVQISAAKTTPTTRSKASTTFDVNTASGITSTGPNRSADNTVTTVNQPVVQYDNTTIMPSTFLGHTISASDVPCIIQCTSQPSGNINSNNVVDPNIPYKVDLKSLSSYRRRYKSADDPRMSSFYIGCVGIAVLVLSILFIILLDCLPSA